MTEIKRGGVFDFEVNRSLKIEDLNDEKTEFLIQDLLVKNSITMWYSKPSQGKTWFTYAVAKKVLQDKTIRAIFYCDFDNGKRQLKERNVDKELLQDDRFRYFHKGKIDTDSVGFIEDINKEAYGQNFKDCLFIYDSTRDFVDNIHNDLHAKRFMQIMKNIREAGGTVILIHHTSKSGRVIDGSGEFTKSTDNAFELMQSGKTPGKLHYLLKVTNDRDSVAECAFTVSLETLDLGDLDPVLSTMTEEDREFINKAQKVLKENEGGINQTSFLESIGFRKDNKTARKQLEKYTSVFWEAEKRGKSTYYTTI